MKREERDVSQHDPVKDHKVMFFFVVVLQFPFDAEDEIDLTLDILGAPLYIPEFLSSDAEDCLTKVIKSRCLKLWRIRRQSWNFEFLHILPN